ncbi:lisH domain-containing protein C1711.05-like isoform X3 [Ipomoea triloba]|nr:lisH domain-containing protein C1711.05-like isoform X3 [Ipomoea triloba]XP_031095579.1 lisH domain-containing protein C1711.05-like isoform X3 [Ipomoea triloba]
MANQLTDECKSLLLHSVLQYLHRNGFSKTLKRFLKEAQIKGDSWKSSSFDLENMYCKYLDTCSYSQCLLWSFMICRNDAKSNFKGQKEQEQHEDGGHESKEVNNQTSAGDTITMKKKKKSNKDKENTVVCMTEIVDGHAKPAPKADEILTDQKLNESNVKSKSKKGEKVSASFNPVDQESEVTKEAVLGSVCDLQAESTEKVKDKKRKKKSALTSESYEGNENQLAQVSGGKQETSECLACQSNDSKNVDEGNAKKEKKKKSKSSKQDTDSFAQNSVEEKPVIKNNHGSFDTIGNGDTHFKDSKKRKRMASDENANQQVEGEDIEESKRRKTEAVKEANNGLENSALEKSRQKQHNDSSEPRTVNAFQRVKVDEVEFVDDRLRDNSYWAKGGADSGYGAKAQEVLGQVRGRGFRHEKTKKKRGSYRGGQIDLQSHSIKFNYSDED